MDPLQNINGLLQEYQKLDRNKGIKRTPDSTSSLNTGSVNDSQSAADAAAKDSVSISSDSKSMLEKQQEVSRYMQELESIHSMDDEQLNKIKGRLESGYYNEPAVTEKVMHDLIFSAPLPANNVFKNAGTEDVKAADTANNSDLAAIREKIQNKEYNSEQVLSTVANKILGIE